MPRKRRVGSTPTSPTSPRVPCVRRAGHASGEPHRVGPSGRPVAPIISRRCSSPPHLPRSRPCSSRSSCRPSASTSRWTRPCGAWPGAPRSPASGPARRPGHARAGARPVGRPRRGDRAPRPGRLPGRADRAGHRAADPGQGRRRPGRGRQAVQVHGHHPGPAGGRPRRLPASTSRPRSSRSTTPRSRQVIDELRDQNATLRPVEDRAGQGRRLRRHRLHRHPATASRSRAARRSGCR